MWVIVGNESSDLWCNEPSINLTLLVSFHIMNVSFYMNNTSQGGGAGQAREAHAPPISFD